MRARRVVVVGAGWAGLAAAVACADRGARVTVLEMAPIAGGRARSLDAGNASNASNAGDAGDDLDNGQHIAIGAYRETLALMAHVGVCAQDAFLRRPFALVGPDGIGLRLPAGAAVPAFVRGVLARPGWSWRDRAALLAAAARWRAAGFRCVPDRTVAELVAALPERPRRELVEPLCIAALNTPAEAASAAVFLRVLGDGLAGGSGASDLLLPRCTLGALLPRPAIAWLAARGADVRLAHRVERIERAGDGWEVDGAACDAVVVAASPVEASRLVAPHDAEWSERAATLAYEPIVTVYARSAGTRLTEPMLMLASDAARPAQFVFDRGQLGGPQGLLAFVASGAAPWVARGLAETERATRAQGEAALAGALRSPLAVVRTVVEKRATFRCTPALRRPRAAIAPGLAAAGDHVAGPYPATLEGAVRSGIEAARLALG